MGDLAGKTAFVTGAGAGIGRAIALEWSGRGGTVAVSDMSAENARGVAAEIAAAGGTAHSYQLDVRNVDEIRRAIAAAAALGGGIDALFNVAGTNLAKNVEECADDEWHMILETNLSSVYRCSKYVLPELRRRGVGAIVNVSSTAGVMAESRCAAYSASKAAILNLTRNMAIDFAKENIRVNAVCPGGTWTPRIEGYMQRTGRTKETGASCPMNRFAEPAEIARPAVFLASSDASFVTGAVLTIDGGKTAGYRVAALDELETAT
jgi:NAD(P)-dependent dehydrogenase (short-subunit alcohol dehydrogenase family)